MKRQNYYPTRMGDQVNWLDNIGEKLAVHGPTLGIAAPRLGEAVNDAGWLQYVLGTWLAAARAFSPASSVAVEEAMLGTGSGPYGLPVFAPPALPAEVTPAPAGALTRLFDLIAILKRSPGYTEAIGADLGVQGSESVSTQSSPKFTAQTQTGPAGDSVRLVFFKYGHMGVTIETRRGESGWEFLAIDTESPYEDQRPLLQPSQPEVREYRMRFWDKGTPNGDWTDIAKATVSP